MVLFVFKLKVNLFQFIKLLFKSFPSCTFFLKNVKLHKAIAVHIPDTNFLEDT